MAETISYELRDRIARIGIRRPERRNAIDRATAGQLRDAWKRFDADTGADVGVLWGEGGHFSAGADLQSFDLEDLPEGYRGFTRMAVRKPTVAAIEGYCVAGGLEMALWCDLRVAGAGAIFACLERRFGVPLVDGGTQRLSRIVGLGRALDMILTGREVGAPEGLTHGLVNQVVEEGHALEAALATAELIASYPQATLRSDRASVYAGIGQPLIDGLETERRLGNEVLSVAVEGAARFRALRDAARRDQL